MSEQTIQSRPRFPLGALLFCLLALALDAPAVVERNVNFAVGSAFPWLAAVLFWLKRGRRVSFRLTPTALEVEEPPQSIPYEGLEGLLAPGRPPNPFKVGPRSYTIQVLHRDGAFRIPARLTVPSDEVFGFLFRQFSPGGSRDVHPSLADFVRRKERDFGPGRVWTYRARTHLGRGPERPRLAAFSLALLLTAVIWLPWGIATRDEGWIGGGSLILVFCGLFAVLAWSTTRRPTGLVRIKHWQKSSLVIAPDGLALVQGDMSGRLAWDEVLDVKVRTRPALFQTYGSTNMPGIVLKVEGAEVVIADLYDRPLPLIYQQVHHYWGSEATEEDWERAGDPPRHRRPPGPPEGYAPPGCRAPRRPRRVWAAHAASLRTQ
jgi:hypothetical protein